MKIIQKVGETMKIIQKVGENMKIIQKVGNMKIFEFLNDSKMPPTPQIPVSLSRHGRCLEQRHTQRQAHIAIRTRTDTSRQLIGVSGATAYQSSPPRARRAVLSTLWAPTLHTVGP